MLDIHRSRRTTAGFLVVATIVASGVVGSGRGVALGAAPAASRPNILLIVSDDQAWSTFSPKLMPSVYSELVDQGVLFRRAYVNTSLCCPSRAQILTGLYEHDTGVDQNNTSLTRPTFVQALHDVGYRTMLAGKYLNSWPCQPRPEFDRWACVGHTKPSSYSLADPYVNVDGTWRQFSGYQTDVLATMASNFIDQTPTDQPFFVMYAPTTPHLPADDPRYDWMPVDPPHGGTFNVNTMTTDTPRYARRPRLTPSEISTSRNEYSAMAHATRSLDDSVGALLSSLGGRARDTLVVYLSDNGYLYGEHRRIGKNDPWEESINVPMVVRYPAVLPSDGAFTSDALVQNVDIAPTIADVAHIPWGADGVSFLPIVAGTRKTVRSAALVEHCRGPSEGSVSCSGLAFQGARARTPGFEGIITSRYKYIEYDDGSKQLVDLRHDPMELRNLVTTGRREALQRSLAARLHAMMHPRLQTTIVTGPGETLDPVFTFFSPSRFATYRCRLTGEGLPDAWHQCAGGSDAFHQLPPGRYMFQVAGVDQYGRSDPTPASRTFTVEAAPAPGVDLNTHPPMAQSSPTASFTYSSSVAGVGVSCSLLPLGPVPCDGGSAAFSDLADGAYTFVVRANDLASGAIVGSSGWYFQVDTTGPRVAFSSAPGHQTRQTDASFSFAAIEPVSGPLSCSVDGRAVDCGGGHLTLGSVGLGAHRLVVEAEDVLGNTGSTSYHWVVDRSAPSVDITYGPSRHGASDDAHFFLHSDFTPQLFLCQLDRLPVMPCFSEASFSGIKVGPHVFTVWSFDAASNRSKPVVYRWTVTHSTG